MNKIIAFGASSSKNSINKKLASYVANKIANQCVIGFFDGKAEFGPRALGSRSILADPRNSKAQKLLNEKIKKRESFRPFAPSILEDKATEDDLIFFNSVEKAKPEKNTGTVNIKGFSIKARARE